MAVLGLAKSPKLTLLIQSLLVVFELIIIQEPIIIIIIQELIILIIIKELIILTIVLIIHYLIKHMLMVTIIFVGIRLVECIIIILRDSLPNHRQVNIVNMVILMVRSISSFGSLARLGFIVFTEGPVIVMRYFEGHFK